MLLSQLDRQGFFILIFAKGVRGVFGVRGAFMFPPFPSGSRQERKEQLYHFHGINIDVRCKRGLL